MRIPIHCDRCEQKRRDRKAAKGRKGVPAKIDIQGLVGSHVRNRQLGQVLATLLVLRRGRWGAKELAAEIGMHWRATYRLLTSMQRAGITIEARKEGWHVYYSIPDEPLRKLLVL